MLFYSVMVRIRPNEECNTSILAFLCEENIDKVGEYDWAGLIMENLRRSKDNWPSKSKYYMEPLTILIFESTKHFASMHS